MDDSRPDWLRLLAERAAQPPLRPREPLRMGTAVVGSVEAELAARLRDGGLLHATLGVSGEPDAALARIARWLHDAGLTRGWRGELLPVKDGQGAELARVERSAVRPLGIATFAVHLIAFAPQGEVWVQQRAHDKATDPGCWDTLMGGLVAAGESHGEALARETWEEAGLRVEALLDLHRADRITIRRPVAEGYLVEHTEVYEAVVPAGLVPLNQDGEVARFDHLAPEAMVQRLAAGDFTLEAALMLAASLQRRGATLPR